MKYRAYLIGDLVAGEIVPPHHDAMRITSSTDPQYGHLYTDDPYGQPEKFHRAIALLDAAADGSNYVELDNVGTRQYHGIYEEVDYCIYASFITGETP